MKGICPKCQDNAALTKHHIKPRRFFGRRKNNEVVYLCAPCHNELERLIPRQKLSAWMYYAIVDYFLGRLAF
jgi:extradiol dioxygenase family protein